MSSLGGQSPKISSMKLFTFYNQLKAIATIIGLLILVILAGCSFRTKNEINVIPGHAHNDYEHKRPLHDALDYRFRSFEADVFSVGDSLFVSHDYEDITPGKTLRSLYLEPLRKRVRENNGSVYGNGEEVILLIDIKDNGIRTYKLLHAILEDYKEMLSWFEAGEKRTGAILVIISGNRPFEFMKSQQVRYAGFDGRIENLDSGIPPGLMPMVSDNWKNHFTWDGTGEMPLEERDRLRDFAVKAKDEGYILRWWGTPDDTPGQEMKVWQALNDAGVGLTGTDNLKELEQFFVQD